MDLRCGPARALTLLLVCASALRCGASWMQLGLTPAGGPFGGLVGGPVGGPFGGLVGGPAGGPAGGPVGGPAGDPEQQDCADLPLSLQQAALCQKKPFLLAGVRAGARLAITECQNQFRHERWNCSTSEDASVFGHELTSGTKETAFIHAMMAAALVHAVTRSCSQGTVTQCGCDARLQEEDWHWGGCSDQYGSDQYGSDQVHSDQVQYGIWFSRQFMDNNLTNTTASGGFTASSLNQHNSEAGRQAVVRTMATHCRCHGVSGSCAVKTCWKTVAAFEQVGLHLKERYERSTQVSDRSRRKTRRKDQRRLPVDPDQLVFFNKSPNYCLQDRRRGVAGTRGRRCSRTSSGADSCVLLCCGRGYNTHLVRQVQRCECKFVWCCYVRCRRCESMNDMHTCK